MSSGSYWFPRPELYEGEAFVFIKECYWHRPIISAPRRLSDASLVRAIDAIQEHEPVPALRFAVPAHMEREVCGMLGEREPSVPAENQSDARASRRASPLYRAALPALRRSLALCE